MIGEVIKKTRDAYGLTASELAEKSGVSVKKIRAQENNAAMLGIDELFKIDHVLDNDVVWELVNQYDTLAR